MAEVDLISQKLMGTDPRVGYGEAGVSSNQVPPLDMRGFELQAQVNAQKAKAEADKQKALQDQINKLDFVNAEGKHTPQYEELKGAYNSQAASMLESGQLDAQRLIKMNADINAFAETGNNEHTAYINDIDKTIPDYNSSYGKNEYNQGEATKVSNVTYNGTPIGGYTGTITRTNKYGQQEQVSIYDPKANPDLYNIEAAADNFTTAYKQLGLNEFATRTDIENGSRTVAIENINKGIYMMVGKDGKAVPGISDNVLDNYLSYGAVNDYYANKILPQYYATDAAAIKAYPELYPQYAGLNEDQIIQSLRQNGDPLRKGLNQDALVKDTARKDLESRNKQSIETSTTVDEDEERVPGGIGVNDSVGTAVELNGQRNFNVSTPTSPGSKPVVKAGWIPSTVYLEQAKLKPINISTQNIADVETNGAFADVLNDKLLSDKYVSGVPFKPTGVSLMPVRPDGTIIVNSEENIRKAKDVQYVPYVNGTVTIDMSDVDKNTEEERAKMQAKINAGEDVKEVGKNIYQYTVLIPYSEANKQMEANYGITQDQINGKLYNPALNLKNLKTNSTTTTTDPLGLF